MGGPALELVVEHRRKPSPFLENNPAMRSSAVCSRVLRGLFLAHRGGFELAELFRAVSTRQEATVSHSSKAARAWCKRAAWGARMSQALVRPGVACTILKSNTSF